LTGLVAAGDLARVRCRVWISGLARTVLGWTFRWTLGGQAGRWFVAGLLNGQVCYWLLVAGRRRSIALAALAALAALISLLTLSTLRAARRRVALVALVARVLLTPLIPLLAVAGWVALSRLTPLVPLIPLTALVSITVGRAIA
jgi:hypothetical protein